MRGHKISRFGLSLTLWISLIYFPLCCTGAGYTAYSPQRCSNRLENALQHMRRRSVGQQVSRSRSMRLETPYSLYYSIYGQRNEEDDVDNFYSGGSGRGGGGFGKRGYYGKNIQRIDNFHSPISELTSLSGGVDFPFSLETNQRQPHKLVVSSVEVEELRVRMPQKASARWVEVDKCKFSMENSTLDTRLIFPDLTLSGKIVLQPTGGKCNMILRLRHAGIEFRTTPIGFDPVNNEESRRLSSASVRTDSHFAEPGFLSVFAHGCEGPTGIHLRQNSKRRFSSANEPMSDNTVPPMAPNIAISEPNVVLGPKRILRWENLHNPFLNKPLPYDIRSDSNKERHWESDVSMNYRDYYDSQPNERDTFYDPKPYNRRFKRETRRNRSYQPHVIEDEMNFNDDILRIDDNLEELIQPDARAFADVFNSAGNGARDKFVTDALSTELEKLFSMGVRGLLTTYMQRALQPAIKETLMENMGYTLSYG